MILALAAMDPTLRGLFFLIAVILFVIAAVLLRPSLAMVLLALGLASGFLVFCWDAFAAAG